MLASVQNPNGELIRFEYDALGRRSAKLTKKEINRYFWDGNVLLHEWKYELKQRPRLKVTDDDLVYDKKEPIENLKTWLYEEGSFAPSAKLVANETFSIINDYIGRPVQAYSSDGNIIWQTDYDIYGNLISLQVERSLMPFRQLGQYEDVETGLYYNRFRYYSPETGTYISVDPIGLAGNNPNFYAYVGDSNIEIDVFGLAGTPWLPHGASQPDVISKGPHFYAGDGITELKLKLDGNGKVDFEEVFTKDSGTSKLNKAINEAREKLINDKSWREKLLKNAGEVKNSLFNTFDRLDRARDVKKIEKALKKMCK
jgi:RHS repeat-associated protein